MAYIFFSCDSLNLKEDITKTSTSLPLENLPVEHLPLENLPVENLPVEHLSVEHLPLENLPVDNFPRQDESSSDFLPCNNTKEKENKKTEDVQNESDAKKDANMNSENKKNTGEEGSDTTQDGKLLEEEKKIIQDDLNNYGRRRSTRLNKAGLDPMVEKAIR